MIFDERLDRALWLMLVADKKNNQKIADFISNIPEELRRQILQKLKVLNEYKNTGEKKISFLRGEIETQDNLLYWFEIDSYFYELDMGYMRVNNGRYEDIFEMSLAMGKDLSEVRNFQKDYIGRIIYDIHTKNIGDICRIVESSENSYNLVKTPLGYMIVYSNEDNETVKHHVTRVNILNMPEEMFVLDLKNKEDVSRLVRRKIR